MDWLIRLAVMVLIFPTDGKAQMFQPVTDTDQQNTPPRQSDPNLPAFALEEQFRELSEKSKRLQAEREELSIAMEQIEAASAEIEGLELALAEANQALADLKKIGLEARSGLKGSGPGGSGIPDRLINGIYAFFAPVEAPDRILQGKLNAYFPPGRTNATPAQAYVADLVASLLSDSFRQRRKAEAFPAMRRIVGSVDYVDRSRSNLSAEELDNLLKEIEQVDQGRMEAVFNESKTAALKILTSLNAKLAEEKKNKDAKWGEIQPQLARINESMRLRTEQKDALDKGLVWAIYGMIFALLLLFIGLRFFPADTAVKLIEHRSLVEIMSMAFILLTIIILGTGDKLGKETLGTLLGTIAGYIFGQKMGAQASGRNQD